MCGRSGAPSENICGNAGVTALDTEPVSIYLFFRYIETHSENECSTQISTTTEANASPAANFATMTVTTVNTVPAGGGTAAVVGRPTPPTLNCAGFSRTAICAW
jgi:hypothetical protein